MDSISSERNRQLAADSADSELLFRIGVLFVTRQLRARRAVCAAAKGGIVTLRGAVPTCGDRQLAVILAQHVAGVIRVNDELTVVQSSRGDSPTASSDPKSDATAASDPSQRRPTNPFAHLPEVDESLEDLLAKSTADADGKDSNPASTADPRQRRKFAVLVFLAMMFGGPPQLTIATTLASRIPDPHASSQTPFAAFPAPLTDQLMPRCRSS